MTKALALSLGTQMRYAILTLLLALPLLAAEPVAHRDLAYVEAGHERQKLDVYTAPDARGRPIVFWIHGGGWQAGDKKEADVKPQALVDKGYVFVSVNYRLLGDGVTIDRMAEDVARGLRWVRDRARQYGADPDRILVTGHSAGAQLAALVCTDHRYFQAEKVPVSAIRGCVPVDGDTYDVPMQIATVEERRANIYRQKFGDEAQQKALSPVTHVARGKRIPPFLILHVADHPEVRGQSQRLAKALDEAGFQARAYPAEGKTHLTINSELGQAGDKPTEAFLEFAGRAFAGRRPQGER